MGDKLITQYFSQKLQKCVSRSRVIAIVCQFKPKLHYIYLVEELSAISSPTSLEQKMFMSLTYLQPAQNMSETWSETRMSASTKPCSSCVAINLAVTVFVCHIWATLWCRPSVSWARRKLVTGNCGRSLVQCGLGRRQKCCQVQSAMSSRNIGRSLAMQ